MTHSVWYRSGQIVAAVGVILSLCLVAYEMKLARDVAIADIYQQRIAMDISLQMHEIPTDELTAAYDKLKEGKEPLSKRETARILFKTDAWVMSKENVYFQYRLGLLDEMEWEVQRFNLLHLLDAPCYREFFQERKGGFREDFAAEVDALLAQLSYTECNIY